MFATAYCAALVHGQNPSSYVYNQNAMRSHLINCLQCEVIQLFPTIRPRRSGIANVITIDVFAIVGTQMMEAKWCNVVDVKTGTILHVLEAQLKREESGIVIIVNS